MEGYVVLTVTKLGCRDEASQTMRLPYDTCWPDLECMMKANFDTDDIVIKYVDDDGDVIIVSSPEELFEAFTVANRNNNHLELVVRCFGTAPPKEDHVITMPKTSMADDIEIVFEESATNPMNERDSATQTTQSTTMEQVCENTTVLTRDEETGTVIRAKAVPATKRLTVSRPVVHDFIAPDATETVVSNGSNAPMQSTSSSQCDSESGEKSPSTISNASCTSIASNSDPVSVQSLAQLLEQLKHELKTEIVQDVITKTQDPAAAVPNTTGSTQTLQADSPYQLFWHEGIICDNCKRTIVGVRYKCGNCLDYDLCEQCETVSCIHEATHVFLKLRRPCPSGGMINNELKPLLRNILYKDDNHIYPAINGCEPVGGDYENIPDDIRRHSKFSKFQVKMAKMLNKKKKEEKLLEMQLKHDEKLKRAYKQAWLYPTKKERLDLTELRNSLGAAFVRDVTIPDETKVLPATRLVKTWRMKNTGKSAWTEKTVMRLKWGNICPIATEETVPLLQPGEKGDVTVCLIAPELPGKYQSHWRMSDSSVSFGPRVWCSIMVEPEPADEASAPVTSQEPVTKENLVTFSGNCKDPPVSSSPVIVSCVNQQPINSKQAAVPIAKKESNVGEVLSSAVAGAMAQLTLEPPRVSGRLAQDLLSFETLNMHNRSTAKASQTATPNNTPLDVSPPKSPTPDMDQLAISNSSSSSNSSSVELLPDDVDSDHNPFVTEFMQHVGSFYHKPDLEADVESLGTLSDDDSSQCDSDFYIVPLPDCFDPSKPLFPCSSDSQGCTGHQVDADLEGQQVDDNHNTIVANSNNLDSPASAASVDELMTCANMNFPPPPALHPTAAGSDSNDEVEAAAVGKEAATPPSPSPRQQLPSPSIVSAAAAAAAGEECVESTSDRIMFQRYQRQQQHQQQQQQQQQREAASGAPAESGHYAMPEQPTISRLDINAATAVDKDDSLQKEALPSSPTDFANQLMTTAVHAASRAAVQVYSTAKDVFYSLQAKPIDGKTTAPMTQQAHYYRSGNAPWLPAENKSGSNPPPCVACLLGGCSRHHVETNVSANTSGASGSNGSSCVACLLGGCPKHPNWSTVSSSTNNGVSSPTGNKGQRQWPKPHFQHEAPTPMMRLIEMGFANRDLNQTLLERHNNDMQKVIQEILLRDESHEWSKKRH